MSNVSVNWFQIPVRNIERAAGFYGSVLGAPLGEIPGPDGIPMKVFVNGDEPMGTLIEGEPSRTGTLIYLNCPDIKGALGRVKRAGGKVLVEETAIGPYGFIAELEDSEGNRVALHRGA